MHYTAQTGHGQKKKIMIVDDNGIFLRTMKSLLQPLYDVVLVKSGEKALQSVVKENPDLILLDYEMPEWDGKKTLEELRQLESSASIPVIFLTAVNDKDHFLSVLKLKPQGYLLKPINSEELLTKIEEVFGT